jgi:hypothetical protein
MTTSATFFRDPFGQLAARQRRLPRKTVGSFSYRYELRRGDEVLATGHLNRDTPLAVGDRITVNGGKGIVRAIEPQLGEREQRLVIQLLRDLDAS